MGIHIYSIEQIDETASFGKVRTSTPPSSDESEQIMHTVLKPLRTRMPPVLPGSFDWLSFTSPMKPAMFKSKHSRHVQPGMIFRWCSMHDMVQEPFFQATLARGFLYMVTHHELSVGGVYSVILYFPERVAVDWRKHSTSNLRINFRIKRFEMHGYGDDQHWYIELLEVGPVRLKKRPPH